MIICNGCKMRFPTESEFEEHARRVHSEDNKELCEWVPCKEKAKWTESSGDGRLVRVCTAHRRLLNKQKIANNNI